MWAVAVVVVVVRCGKTVQSLETVGMARMRMMFEAHDEERKPEASVLVPRVHSTSSFAITARIVL
jgi:hypothetical protein